MVQELILKQRSSFLTAENFRKPCVWFSEIFREYKIGTLAQNGLSALTSLLEITIAIKNGKIVWKHGPIVDSFART